MKKSLFYITLLLTFINSTPAFAHSFDANTALGFFFTTTLISSLSVFLIKKCKKEQITSITLINQTFKTSAITLATLSLIAIYLMEEPERYIGVAILLLNSILADIKELPNPENSKIKTFLSKAIIITIISYQCIILLLFSLILGIVPCGYTYPPILSPFLFFYHQISYFFI